MQTSISQISVLVRQNKPDINQLKSSAISSDTKLTAQEKSIASLELVVNNSKDEFTTNQKELVDLKNESKAKLDEAVNHAVSKVASADMEITFSEFCNRLRRSKNFQNS